MREDLSNDWPTPPRSFAASDLSIEGQRGVMGLRGVRIVFLVFAASLEPGGQDDRRKHSRGDPMKITSFYYLKYPGSLPEDPFVAEREVYVEVAFEEGLLRAST
jgi:hypothetical protein